MKHRVSFVVPVWNRADLLRNLLETISRQTMAPLEVIVVDNGSSDDAVEVAGEYGARVILMGRNAGFAAAVNRGIRESHGEWIAIVNSDVELMRDWLARLLAKMDESSAFAGAGKTLRASDPSRIDGTWDLLACSGCPIRAGHGRPDSAFFNESRCIDFVPATASLYRRDLFDRVGLFGELYESYLEDVDLSMRSCAAGLKAVYEPAAVCLHHGSASSGVWSSRVVRLTARNQLILVKRLFSVPIRLRWCWKIVVGQMFWGIVAARHGKIIPWVCGKLEAIWLWRRIPSLRLESDLVRRTVSQSESQIAELICSGRPGPYWRLYFLLTGRASK